MPCIMFITTPLAQASHWALPCSSSCPKWGEDSARQGDAHKFPPHLVSSPSGGYQRSHHCLHPGVWREQWWNPSTQCLPLWSGWGIHSDRTETSHWVLCEGGSCECCWKESLLWTSASPDSARQWVPQYWNMSLHKQPGSQLWCACVHIHSSLSLLH